jgi:hypothetical protein
MAALPSYSIGNPSKSERIRCGNLQEHCNLVLTPGAATCLFAVGLRTSVIRILLSGQLLYPKPLQPEATCLLHRGATSDKLVLRVLPVAGPGFRGGDSGRRPCANGLLDARPHRANVIQRSKTGPERQARRPEARLSNLERGRPSGAC